MHIVMPQGDSVERRGRCLGGRQRYPHGCAEPPAKISSLFVVAATTANISAAAADGCFRFYFWLTGVDARPPVNHSYHIHHLRIHSHTAQHPSNAPTSSNATFPVFSFPSGFLSPFFSFPLLCSAYLLYTGVLYVHR